MNTEPLFRLRSWLWLAFFAVLGSGQALLIWHHVTQGLRWQLDAAALVVCLYGLWNNSEHLWLVRKAKKLMDPIQTEEMPIAVGATREVNYTPALPLHPGFLLEPVQGCDGLIVKRVVINGENQLATQEGVPAALFELGDAFRMIRMPRLTREGLMTVHFLNAGTEEARFRLWFGSPEKLQEKEHELALERSKRESRQKLGAP